MAALLVLSALYVGLGDTAVMSALFTGLGAAVVAIVVQALVRVAGRALTHRCSSRRGRRRVRGAHGVRRAVPDRDRRRGGAGLACGAPHPRHHRRGSHGAKRSGEAPALVADDALHAETASTARAVRTLGLGIVVWTVPIAAAAVLTGPGSVYTSQGLFFAGTALVTFGVRTPCSRSSPSRPSRPTAG